MNWKKAAACLLTFATLLGTQLSFTEAMSFSAGERLELYKPKPFKLSQDGGKITYAYDNQTGHVSRLTFNYKGKERQTLILQYNAALMDFSARLINGHDPSMKLIEVICTGGNIGATYGYWLIGERDGKLVPYVTMESLKNMGFVLTNEGRAITRVRSRVQQGELLLTFDHDEERGEYGYQRVFPVDAKIQVDWDENAQWFSLRNIAF